MGYSKSKVVKAGKLLRKENQDTDKISEAMDVLAEWKSQHALPLDKAYNEIVQVALKIDKRAVVARREKRARSIIDKLRREPTMSLTTMQDIGGCRAIVRTEKDVKKIATLLKKKSHIQPVNNYIKKPKKDGYKGLHLVGSYSSGGSRTFSIEFQLRTKIQHAWATAGEITELFTSKSIKHMQGDVEWKGFYKELSDVYEIIQNKFVSRDFDFDGFDYHRLSRELKNILTKDQSNAIRKLKIQEKSLKVRKDFEAYANSLNIVDQVLGDKVEDDGYAVVHIYDLNTQKPSVQLTYYAALDLDKAQQQTYNLEKKIADGENELVVLLSTQAIGGIREAYPNYFADSMLFTKLLLAILD